MSTHLVNPKRKPGPKSSLNGRGNPTRLTEIVINGNVRIPRSVKDFDSFHRWVLSEDHPDQGKFSWFGDTLWVEAFSELVNHLSDAELARMRAQAQALGPVRQAANGSHAGDILIDEIIRIPHWVRNLDSFRRWAFSDVFPEHGRIAFLAGKVWVDMSMETLFHSQIKTVITIVVGSIVLNESLGFFCADKMRMANRASGLSNEPDAMFVSNVSLEKGLAVLKNGDQSIEVTGSVDMALEVISKSSVGKDTIDARKAYAKAGIAEYWLVDSTVEIPELAIYRLTGGKYVAARKRDGWVKSNVFGRSFRLTCRKDAEGVSHFNLETK